MYTPGAELEQDHEVPSGNRRLCQSPVARRLVGRVAPNEPVSNGESGVTSLFWRVRGHVLIPGVPQLGVSETTDQILRQCDGFQLRILTLNQSSVTQGHASRGYSSSSR